MWATSLRHGLCNETFRHDPCDTRGPWTSQPWRRSRPRSVRSHLWISATMAYRASRNVARADHSHRIRDLSLLANRVVATKVTVDYHGDEVNRAYNSLFGFNRGVGGARHKMYLDAIEKSKRPSPRCRKPRASCSMFSERPGGATVEHRAPRCASY